MGHLVEAVPGRDRADLDRFKQDVIARVAFVRRRHVASDPFHSNISNKRSGCNAFVSQALQSLRADKQRVPFLRPSSFTHGLTKAALVSVQYLVE
jgi:hypothetical protein